MGECLITRRSGESYELPVLNPSYPQNVTVTQAATVTATFSVVISTPGKPAEYTYQWYLNGSPISGATSATYTHNAYRAVGNYTVYCNVSNKAGTVNSRNATFTVRSYLPTYTYSGSAQLIDDGNFNWRLKLLTSGTLTFSYFGSGGGSVQAFLVGAGGGGGGYDVGIRSGGGGGGYTATSNVTLPLSQAITATIGGSSPGARGGTSSLVCSAAAINLSAAGGYPGVPSGPGGNGGSGGGGSNNANGAAGSGGSNGSNGFASAGGSGTSPTNGGIGQGSTTREFGEAGGTLYAGGGGGGFGNSDAGRAGGAGGGGTGGGWSGPPATNGQPNTGGGAGGNGHLTGVIAAGGSGIVIIRNHR